MKKNRHKARRSTSPVTGVLQVTSGGDAFVRPDAAPHADVFVPARNQASAMDGDRVAVRIESRPRRRSPVGQVVNVLERSHPIVVGTLHVNQALRFVEPLERRIARDILIPEGKEGEAGHGHVVVVRMIQFGDRRHNSIGEVERVLGSIDDPGVDVLAIVHSYGLAAEFSPDVEAAARKAEGRGRDGGARSDRRDLHVLTIDPSDAKDHDDALSLVSVKEGVWEVGVHIADVSHFVEEGSLLDLEAFRRGTSVYLVDQVIPMLPHRLSSNLCSLTEGEDRLAVSLFLTIDEDGEVQSHRFERTWIRSAHRLDYGTVQRVLAGETSVDPATDDLLRTLDRLAHALRAIRRARGSLDFELPEATVILDEKGAPIDIRKSEQLDSHRLIEDFMILANEVVANEAERRRLPIPFRIHEPPTMDRVRELREFLTSIGQSLPRGNLGSKGLQAVLDRTADQPESSLVSTVILKSMSRARYDAQNLGHFGLASKAYAHFTSPIRRYPDLVLHRVIVRALIEGKPLEDSDRADVETMAAHATEREQLAQKAERDSIEMKKTEFIARHLGEEFDGTISGVTRFGFFVSLDRYFVEGLVHVSSMDDDYFEFVPESYSLVGERSKRRFRLGDRVRTRVARVNKEERRIDFTLLS